MNRTIMMLKRMDMAAFTQYGAVIGVLLSLNKEKTLKDAGRRLEGKNSNCSKMA